MSDETVIELDDMAKSFALDWVYPEVQKGTLIDETKLLSWMKAFIVQDLPTRKDFDAFMPWAYVLVKRVLPPNVPTPLDLRVLHILSELNLQKVDAKLKPKPELD
jgi:hypothetical protein